VWQDDLVTIDFEKHTLVFMHSIHNRTPAARQAYCHIVDLMYNDDFMIYDMPIYAVLAVGECRAHCVYCGGSWRIDTGRSCPDCGATPSMGDIREEAGAEIRACGSWELGGLQ
jgi:hypothetical protein